MPRYFELPKPAASRTALLTVLALLTLHILDTWGVIITFRGDAGRWLHEASRFASGEMLYRDFTWPFPPLAMWLLGGVGRLLGSDLWVFWTITALIASGIFVCYARYAARLAPRELLLPVTAAGFLLAVSFANWRAAPLPMGMYAPSLTLGLLTFLTAVLCLLDWIEDSRPVTGIALGVFAGLSVLAKQEFWIPAAYLVAAACATALLERRARALALCAAVAAAFSVAVGAGVLTVLCTSDMEGLRGALTGFGHMREFSSRSLPTGKQIVLEFLAGSLLVPALAACLAVTRAVSWRSAMKWIAGAGAVFAAALALFLYVNYQIALDVRAHGLSDYSTGTEEFLAAGLGSGAQIMKRSLVLLRGELPNHLVPLLFPAGLLVLLLWRWKRAQPAPLRNTALVLLGLCLACRSRRVFSQVDWFHFLLEIPVYLLVARVLLDWEKARRGLALALALLTAGGAFCYWKMTTGSISTPGGWVKVETPRGAVRLAPVEAEAYHALHTALERIDPRGRRPLFAIGSSGGYNYFLGRANPTPLSQGFVFTRFQAEPVIATLLAAQPPAILIYHSQFLRMTTPVHTLSRFWWEPQNGPIHFARVDERHFALLRAVCPAEQDVRVQSTVFTLHDCALRRPPL